MLPAPTVCVSPVVQLPTRETDEELPPKVTVAGPRKSVPLIVTDVPPPGGPPIGLIALITGGGLKAKALLRVSLCVSRWVTTTFTVPAE